MFVLQSFLGHADYGIFMSSMQTCCKISEPWHFIDGLFQRFLCSLTILVMGDTICFLSIITITEMQQLGNGDGRIRVRESRGNQFCPWCLVCGF